MKHDLLVLLSIHKKRKEGIPLTDEEVRIWEEYRQSHPLEELTEEGIKKLLSRWPKAVQPWEHFDDEYVRPAIAAAEQQLKAVDSVRRLLAFRYWAPAIIFILVIGIGVGWLLMHKPAPEWETLRVPRGKQLMLKLSDGTKVWLNAASVLRYPAVFGEGERIVELTEGEAYFEVTKTPAAQRFIVRCNKQKIEVLGTKFNIRAYPQEEFVTTLIEGSVRVGYGRQNKQLTPGQQAVTGNQNNLLVVKANLKETTAWKYKYFEFDNKRLSEIMAEVQRWYNVDVTYLDPLQDERFMISEFPRSEPISRLLNDLQASRLVHFEVQGRRIYVRK